MVLGPTRDLSETSPFDREEIDAYEIGWRSRPNEDFLIELSSYYYDSKDAVLAATSTTSVTAYEVKDAKLTEENFRLIGKLATHGEVRGGYLLPVVKWKARGNSIFQSRPLA